MRKRKRSRYSINGIILCVLVFFAITGTVFCMVVNGQGAAAERAKVEAERKEQEEKKAAEEAVKKAEEEAERKRAEDSSRLVRRTRIRRKRLFTLRSMTVHQKIHRRYWIFLNSTA